MDAGFFNAADVEVMGIEELHDDDAEDVVVGDVFGGLDEGEAAEQVFEGQGARVGGVVGGEGFEDLVFGRIGFVRR